MKADMESRFSAFVGVLVCAGVLLLVGPWGVRIEGHQVAASWSGTYTDAQAGRGETLYKANCVACHGTTLMGGDRAPALAGPAFLGAWAGKPIAALLEYVHTQMPLQSPGGLSRQQSADIVAYMLRVNKIAAGSSELRGGPDAKPAASPAREGGIESGAFYTTEQAARGKTAFNRNCAFCHSVDAKLWTPEGNRSIFPPTLGGRFLERVYHGHLLYPSVYHLYRKMESMPAFDTNAISAQTRADILTYILEKNGMPAGRHELTPDTNLMKSMMLNEREFESLFNGRDFTGFRFVLGPRCIAAPDGCGKTEPGTVLRVEKGAIYCACNIHGYFYWDKAYKDFTFRYEQKFERPADWDPADPLYFGGTGALVFIQPPHAVFPRSLEIEGRYLDLGEPFPIQGKGKITYDHAARMRSGRPVGEWDAIEVVSKNGTVQTFINGTLVSTFTDHDYPAGQLGMQTEGAPVWWRNLRVKAE